MRWLVLFALAVVLASIGVSCLFVGAVLLAQPAPVRVVLAWDLDATHAGVVRWDVRTDSGQIRQCLPVRVLATERRCGPVEVPAAWQTIELRGMLGTGGLGPWSEPVRSAGIAPGVLRVTRVVTPGS